MRRALRSACVALGLAALVTLTSATEPAPAAHPLADEDIVKMVAAGTPESEILERIAAQPGAYDLSDDMLSELRLAGVTPAVLAAMRARAVKDTPAPPPPERAPRGTAHLVVTLNGGHAKTLTVPAWADEDLKGRLHLGKEQDDRTVKDIAVFLGCTTAEHIPDLWRDKTPLGHDMASAFRHEMLTFVAGDTPAGKKPRIALPATLEADVDELEPHDLILGVAARIGDRWMLLSAGSLAKVKVESAGVHLDGTIGKVPTQAFAFQVKLAPPPK